MLLAIDSHDGDGFATKGSVDAPIALAQAVISPSPQSSNLARASCSGC